MNNTDYETQAKDFLEKTNTTFKAEFVGYKKHFVDDKEKRDVYKITLQRGERKFIFDFGQSINDSGFKLINKNTKEEPKYFWLEEANEHTQRDKKEFKLFAWRRLNQSLDPFIIKEPVAPTPYDVLACLTTYDPVDFKNFCDSYGYDEDSRKAEKVYKAVVDEYKNVCMLWNEDELKQLREIN